MPTECVVIHHRNCFDGVAAAWVVDQYLKRVYPGSIDVTYVPADYGDTPPDVKGKRVFIVDFSYPRPILEQMLLEADSLLVLDHHKTSAEALNGFAHAVFDMDRSGVGIAWDWFNAGVPRPWLVNCIEDRDIHWPHKLPLTKEQMAFIATVPMKVELYQELSCHHPEEIKARGEHILKYITNYGHKAIEHAVMREIGGYAFWVINVSYQNCSDHLDLMMGVKQVDAAAYFFLHGNGKWQFGLRSRGDFDVSEVAKKYGGGGHKNASGFTVDKLPWQK